MTLAEFYDNLPPRTSPKSDFVREIMASCHVEHVTVRQWVKGKSSPSNPEHRKLLAKVTGVPEEELFPKRTKND